MKNLKALEILKKLQIDVKKDIEAEGIEVFGYINTAIEEAIEELEALENRSCDNCSKDYVKCRIFVTYWNKTKTSYIFDSKTFYCNDYKQR